MRKLAFIAVALLAACGEARAPVPREQAAEARSWLYNATSETARSFTGDLTLEPTALNFAKGARLTTHVIARRTPAEPIAQGGPSFAATALGAPDIVVEVRAVTAQTLAQGAPSLCTDGAQPTFVALAYAQRATRVTLMVFEGTEAPGWNASKSTLCATYVYAAPDGVRTRQGVLL